MKRGLAGLVAAAVLGCGGPDPVAPPPPEVTSLTVTPLQAIVTGGERVTATAVARTAQGSVAPVTIDWTSSDPLVATVTSSGTIAAVGNGTATITASAGSFSATLEFRVAPPSLGRIVDSVRRAFGLPAMGRD